MVGDKRQSFRGTQKGELSCLSHFQKLVTLAYKYQVSPGIPLVPLYLQHIVCPLSSNQSQRTEEEWQNKVLLHTASIF